MAQPHPVTVTTNSFLINKLPDPTFYQYEAFDPAIPVPAKRVLAIHKLQTQNAAAFNPPGVYDGRLSLYMSKQLSIMGSSVSFAVYLGDHSPPPVAGPGVRGYVTVRVARTAAEAIRFSEIYQFIAAGVNGNVNKLATATTVIQLLIRQAINEQNPTHTQHAFFMKPDRNDPRRRRPGRGLTDAGLQIWEGFYHSARPVIVRDSPTTYRPHMVITVNSSIAAVLDSGPGNIIQLATRLFNMSHRDLNNPVILRKLLAHLKSRRIQVNTPTRRPRVATVQDIVPNVGAFQFTKDDHRTTIAFSPMKNYYQRAYGFSLQYGSSIGITIANADTDFPVIIPAELCTLLYKRRLSPAATADAIAISIKSSPERLQTILGNDSPIWQYQNSPYVRSSGMQIATTPLEVRANMLPPPDMLFGSGPPLRIEPGKGSWNVVGKRFHTPATMLTWAVMSLINTSEQDLARIVQYMGDACHKAGMQIDKPKVVRKNPQDLIKVRVEKFCVRRVLTIDEGLEELYAEAVKHAEARERERAPAQEEARRQAAALGKPFRPEPPQQPLDMVVVILPAQAGDLRHQVKFWSLIMSGVRAQCVREGKVKPDDQYMNNVAIKINARLGGRYAIPAPGVVERIPGRYMICGADVAHPSPGVLRPSVAGLVYSTDKQATLYRGEAVLQHPRVEVIENLKEMMMNAILGFGSEHLPPEYIIFYRDGVSEGEMQKVQQYEIQAIKDACQEVWTEKKVEGPLPKITFIVVVKRHQQRFYPRPGTIADRKGNCMAGLCVSEMKSPLGLDFYLQSHAAIQGVPRPAHYSVLLDEIFGKNLEPIQMASWQICHGYAKATRSVSIPSPVYYADKLCADAKFRFHWDDQDQLDAESMANEDETFDLRAWQQRFYAIHPGRRGDFRRTMYFL
ncbi:Argonaute-like protein [Mycena kentingensis (nom. inval.)]|nr:Argonaute-like protein [Mycena kentingensis (nom. inval.)]